MHDLRQLFHDLRQLFHDLCYVFTVGGASRDTAEALARLLVAVRGVLATGAAPPQQMVPAARDVLARAQQLLEEARKAVNNPHSPDTHSRLATAAKAVSHSLNSCVNCLPGLRDVDSAVKHVALVSQKLSTTNVSHGRSDS